MATSRAAGVGVLAGAVLLLAVLAGQAPRTVGGTAVAAPVPGEPGVGQCLVEQASSDAVLSDDQGLRSPGRELRDCRTEAEPGVVGSTVVVGEVAAVLTERSGRPRDACAVGASIFVGGSGVVLAGAWTVAGGPAVLITGPDRRQWADGQRWQACVVVPSRWTADGVFDPTRGIGPVLRESARGRWSDPTYRDRLGDCFAVYSGAVAELLSPAFCGQGHELERLGLSDGVVDPRSAAVLRQTCRELAVARTTAADPTYDGQLRVAVVVTGPDGSSREIDDGDELPAEATADCVIRPADPSMLLTGTVIGLGAAPVPLASR